MTQVTAIFFEVEGFVKEINNLRLQNKNKWYTYQGTVNNKTVALKGYGTWLQILRVDGLTFPTVADISVTEFKQVLKGAVED